MKGYATDKRRLRRRVFEEIARLGYEGAGSGSHRSASV